MALSKESIKAKVEAAAKVSVDANDAKSGGYEPPAKGLAMLRFISWVELGDHKTTFKGQDRVTWKAEATFELHGKNYPVEEYEGKKIAKRITVKLNVPAPGQKPSAKSRYYKLFRAMNYDNQATHIAQMLGNAFIGNVFHREYESEGETRVAAQFNDPDIDESALTIRQPVIEVMDDSGEPTVRPVKVPPQVGETRLFLWSTPDKEQWDSIYIDGVYENKDAKGKVTSTRSKNVLQETLKKAVSYEGSELEALLLGDPDTGDVDDPSDDLPVDEPAPTKPANKKGAAKGQNGTKAASKEAGGTKGSQKAEKPAKAPQKPSKSKVEDNPLEDLADYDDDIPF